MKQDIENLIDRLADKSLRFGCLIRLKPAILDEPRNYPVLKKLITFKSAQEDDRYEYLDPNHGALIFHPKDVEVLGHELYLHQVLEKMRHMNRAGLRGVEPELNLLGFWEPFTLTKPLQEIYAEAEWGWETYHSTGCKNHHNTPSCECGASQTQFLKQPAIRELFSFILSLSL